MGGGVWARCVRFGETGSGRSALGPGVERSRNFTCARARKAALWKRDAGIIGMSGILRVPGVALEPENAVVGICWNLGISMRPRYRNFEVRPGLSLS